MGSRATVTSKGQVTIPVTVRRQRRPSDRAGALERAAIDDQPERHGADGDLVQPSRHECRGFQPSRSAILRQLNTESNAPWPAAKRAPGP